MDALGLLLPRGCAGCDAPDTVLCDDCCALFAQTYTAPLPQTVAGSVVSCAVYRGCVRRAILAWKDHGDTELDAPLSAALIALTDRCRVLHLLQAEPAYPLCIVPAPSSPRSVMRRGRRHLVPLARTLTATLRSRGYEARMCHALNAMRVRGKSVSTRGRAGRLHRLDGGFAVRSRAIPLLRGTRVILLDDIVTTGTTLRHGVSALRQAGAIPLGALTLVATPPPAQV